VLDDERIVRHLERELGRMQDEFDHLERTLTPRVTLNRASSVSSNFNSELAALEQSITKLTDLMIKNQQQSSLPTPEVPKFDGNPLSKAALVIKQLIIEKSSIIWNNTQPVDQRNL
jgi:hypothetical protein